MNQTGAVVRAFQNNPTNSSSEFSLMSRLGKRVIAGAVGLGLLFVAANSQAQVATNYWWTGADNNGVWEDANNWVISNAAATTTYPGVIGSYADSVQFTNSGTYSVSINSGDTIVPSNCVFSATSGTVATITLTLNGTATLNPFIPGDGIVVADGSNETTTVWLATTNNPSYGLDISGAAAIGHDGIGTLIVTNGYVISSGVVDIGNGVGQGTIIISGPNTYWSAYQFSIGNTNASYGDSLIVSNSGSLVVSSTFRIGSSSSTASSNCQFIVTDGAIVTITGGSPLTVGNRATVTGSAAYNNTVTIGNGGVINIPDHSIVVGDSATLESGIACSSCAGSGTIATGNVFMVQAGGVVSNATQIAVTTSNTLALYGGIFGGGSLTYLGNITNYGVFQGWGTIVGTLNTGSNVTYGSLGFTAVSNQVGALVLSNGFTLATNTVLQISLGTNYNPIAVGLGQADPPASGLVSNNYLILNGIINFVNSGGFTAPNTYTLFTYPPSMVVTCGSCGTLINSNRFEVAPVIGSVPNPAYTYTISTNTPGEINLIVGCTNCTPALPFQITSISRTNSGVDGNNDILIKWNTTGTNNHVLVSSGTANGSYSTNTFTSVASIAVTTTITNYVDVGGATNVPTRYYRISSP